MYSRKTEIKSSFVVIGLVGHIGVDFDFFINTLEDNFKVKNWEVETIHISSLFTNDSLKGLFDPFVVENKLKSQSAGELTPSTGYRTALEKMIIGNEVSDANNDAICNVVLDKIKGFDRTVYVVRSFKRKNEIDFFYREFGDNFFLVALHANKDTRIHNLAERYGIKNNEALNLIQKDCNDFAQSGQNLSKSFQFADTFIDSSNRPNVREQTKRLVEILFCHPYVQPTIDEVSMATAYIASLQSMDLSRQVGAAIIDSSNNIIATGCNEVPKFGGGIYSVDYALNHNDLSIGYDTNYHEICSVTAQIVEQFRESLDHDKLKNAVESVLSGKLTEFYRTVHAEMNALMQLARTNISSKDCVMYATTLPCHGCAKHIIGSGIKSVIYIEPYEKSCTFRLHSDSVTDGNECVDKVNFRQFFGISPKRFISFFASAKKDMLQTNGLLVDLSRKSNDKKSKGQVLRVDEYSREIPRIAIIVYK